MGSNDKVEQQVEALGIWYQHFRFPNGVRTGTDQKLGYDAELRWALIDPYLPKDLTGKTVLDLGGNAGFFSIQMKLKGALRCVLVDPYAECLRQASFASEQFQVDLELINHDAHTYCLTTEERFDYVLFLGLLYHLKYPGIVLDRLAEMTKDRIFILSAIVGLERETHEHKDDYERRKDDSLLKDPTFPKLVFIENSYNHDLTNWWLPNFAALEAMVRSAGLRILDRPHPHLIVAEPEVYRGKVIFPKLVFPAYGKRGGPTFPGPQVHDPVHWLDIARQSRLREASNRFTVTNLIRSIVAPLKRSAIRMYCILRATFLSSTRS